MVSISHLWGWQPWEGRLSEGGPWQPWEVPGRQIETPAASQEPTQRLPCHTCANERYITRIRSMKSCDKMCLRTRSEFDGMNYLCEFDFLCLFLDIQLSHSIESSLILWLPEIRNRPGWVCLLDPSGKQAGVEHLELPPLLVLPPHHGVQRVVEQLSYQRRHRHSSS